MKELLLLLQRIAIFFNKYFKNCIEIKIKLSYSRKYFENAKNIVFIYVRKGNFIKVSNKF